MIDVSTTIIHLLPSPGDYDRSLKIKTKNKNLQKMTITAYCEFCHSNGLQKDLWMFERWM